MSTLHSNYEAEFDTIDTWNIAYKILCSLFSFKTVCKKNPTTSVTIYHTYTHYNILYDIKWYIILLLSDGAVSFIYYDFGAIFFFGPAGTNTSPRHNNMCVCHPNRSCRRGTSISWSLSHAKDAFYRGSARRNERAFLRLLLEGKKTFPNGFSSILIG